MIYLADIRNWLKQFNIADYYYSGKLDANKEKAVCVYQRKSTIEAVRAIGGKSSYNINLFRCLYTGIKTQQKQRKPLTSYTNSLRRFLHFCLMIRKYIS